jgi:S-adenosylmethionine decarboxylase proenzyme
MGKNHVTGLNENNMNNVIEMAHMELGAAVGVHVLLNVYDVPPSKEQLLTFLESGRPVLNEIVHQLRLNVMSETGHQFSPMGYSYAYVLSESHFTIHTYPEYRSCYIDLFCCNPAFQPSEMIRLVKEHFGTDKVHYQVVSR